ncbi:Ultraviolet-B receptor UVR8 [Picochlorum sp. SENEW3]|nr:Ultraviolet-B receptor UVR8 [Picochlorum sp. SENEW3]
MKKRILTTFGNGDCGRLGHGTPCTSIEIPKQVSAPILEGFEYIQVACGGAHTLALSTEGSVVSFGLNDKGQLGHTESEAWVAEPIDVPIPEDVVRVAAGHYHSLAVDRNGGVWAWGQNGSGQLGLGKEVHTTCDPRLVASIKDSDIVYAAAGAAHSLLVSSAGELYSCGDGAHGRLGHGTAGSSSIFRYISTQEEYIPRKVRALEAKKIVAAAAGHMHSACIDSDGFVYTFGNGRHLQLGTGTRDDSSIPIKVQGLESVGSLACGGYHSLASTHYGKTMVWGAEQQGCLGLGSSVPHGVLRPQPIPDFQSISVAAGWKHSAAIDDRGWAHCWGWGGSQGTAMSIDHGGSGGGQLGGDDCDAWSPRRIVTIEMADGLEVPQSQSQGHLIWKAVSMSCGLNHTAMIVELINGAD